MKQKGFKQKSINRRGMEEIYKEDYKYLRYYAKIRRVDMLATQKNKAEKRLIRLGYITFDKKSKKLYHKDYVLTKRGEKRFLELKKIYQKDWHFWISVGTFIIAVISLYFSLKALGWI